jgi:hypothetical protein
MDSQRDGRLAANTIVLLWYHHAITIEYDAAAEEF